VSNPIQSELSRLRAENAELLNFARAVSVESIYPFDKFRADFGFCKSQIPSAATRLVEKIDATHAADNAHMASILRNSLPVAVEAAPPVPESLKRALTHCGNPDEELIAEHEANPESFREPLPFDSTRPRYFRETSTGMEWVWNGVKMTCDGEESIFGSPAEILGCLDVIETDAASNPLAPPPVTP